MANSTPAKPANDDAAQPANIENRVSYRFRAFVKAEAERNREDNWEVTARQLDKMLTAETLDEIMDSDEGGTYQGRDLVGFEFKVEDQQFSYRESSDEFESALGAYIQFQATALMEYPEQGISPGDLVTISTGASLIIGKLRTLQANGFLPMDLKIIAGGGKGVLKLVRAPKRTVSSTTA